MTATKEEPLALAERVEGLNGPDREVDAEIVCALDRRPDWLLFSHGVLWVDRSARYPVVRFCDERMSKNAGNPSVDEVPHFTVSLDAAMTLVPEGWAVERVSYWPATPEGASNVTASQSSATLVGTSLSRFGRKMVWGHSSKDGRVNATSATPALALTAAALRAHAELVV